VRKRSHSSRGDEFIDCNSLDLPPQLPKVSASELSATRSKFLNPFVTRRNRADVPEIHVEQETTVTSEARHTSQDDWAIESPMLPRPVHTAYGNNSHVASESDGGFLIGRLV
jgi:hypothetical protein